MAKLDHFLKDWVAQKLIGQDQADAIAAYEETKPKRNWVLYGFLALGSTVVSIGVISLVAANWEAIPAFIKILVNFLVLGGMAYLAFWLYQGKHEVFFESVLVFYFFLCLASIGLISQVYHSGGEPYQALIFWAVITFSLALIAKYQVVPFIWSLGFLVALIFAVEHIGLVGFSTDRYDEVDRYIGIFMLLPLFCAAVYNSLSLTVHAEPFHKAFGFFTLLTGVVGLIIADVLLSSTDGDLEATLDGLYGVAILSILVLLPLNLRKDIRSVPMLLWITTFLWYVLITVFVLLFRTEHESPFVVFELGEWLGAVLVIPMCLLIAVYFAVIKKAKLFHLFTLVVAIRFLIVYFHIFGDLATTGIGLIASGVLIIGLSLLWYFQRTKLHTLVEQWAD